MTLPEDATREESSIPSRQTRHPKERLRPIHIVHWLLSPLHVRLREPSMWPRNRYARPADIPPTSRNRQRRRAKRLRLRSMLRTRRIMKRLGVGATVLIFLAALTFWAKFAVVYDIPPFLRHGVLIQARDYVVLKSWWFGPPLFNLNQYPVDPSAPLRSLVTQLGRYQGIVTDPSEILFVW